MWRMSTAWCRSTSSPACRNRSRNWRKFSFMGSPAGVWGQGAKLPGGGGLRQSFRSSLVRQSALILAVGRWLTKPSALGTMEREILEDHVAGKTMKALVLRKHGGLGDLEVVGDYPVPQATEGNVVIRVRASSFNYHDVFTVKGMPGIKVPLPVVIGLDMAGEIAEVGAGVTGWKAGDRVLVNPVNKKKGLMGKMLGAEVIACASSDEKLARLKAMGADEVVDYTKTDWSKWAVEKYGKPQRRSYEGGVDVVINFTGGDTWHPSLRCLKRGGKLLVCGATAGYDPKEDLRYVWSFELNIIGSNSFYDDDLRALMTLVADGKMRPVIDKVLPLAEAREGLRLIQDREVIGKVVVAP